MNFRGLIVPVDVSFPKTSATGTALQRVANRPIICHVLEGLCAAGAKEAVVVADTAHVEELRRTIAEEGPAGIAVEYVPRGERGLRAAERLLGDAPCVVHAANGLLAQPLGPLIETLQQSSHDVLALVHRRHAVNGSVGLATRRVLRLANMTGEEMGLELAGVWLLGASALREALAHGSSLIDGPGRELDVVAIAERLAASGGSVAVQPVVGWRRNSGAVEDLLELNRIAFDTLPREPSLDGIETTAENDDNRLEGYVDIHPTARVQASVVVGPARIGPGAEINDSYIGPYTAIGADARIESAEVERSIIMAGASIMHIGGRLVGSVVGRDARIFRDFSLPRALRVNVGDGNEVALC